MLGLEENYILIWTVTLHQLHTFSSFFSHSYAIAAWNLLKTKCSTVGMLKTINQHTSSTLPLCSPLEYRFRCWIHHLFFPEFAFFALLLLRLSEIYLTFSVHNKRHKPRGHMCTFNSFCITISIYIFSRSWTLVLLASSSLYEASVFLLIEYNEYQTLKGEPRTSIYTKWKKHLSTSWK